jgi:hypothetical protein
MTGGQLLRDAPRALEGRTRAIIDNGDAPSELCANLIGPFLAAAAAWIAMHNYGSGSIRCRRKEESGQHRKAGSFLQFVILRT